MGNISQQNAFALTQKSNIIFEKIKNKICNQ